MQLFPIVVNLNREFFFTFSLHFKQKRCHTKGVISCNFKQQVQFSLSHFLKELRSLATTTKLRGDYQPPNYLLLQYYHHN